MLAEARQKHIILAHSNGDLWRGVRLVELFLFWGGDEPPILSASATSPFEVAPSPKAQTATRG